MFLVLGHDHLTENINEVKILRVTEEYWQAKNELKSLSQLDEVRDLCILDGREILRLMFLQFK